MTNKAIGNVVANLITAPVGLCTCKVAMDVVTQLLPAPVSVPVKIAYKVGTVGVGILANQAIAKTVSEAVNEVCDAVDNVEEAKKEAQQQTKKHLKEVGA